MAVRRESAMASPPGTGRRRVGRNSVSKKFKTSPEEETGPDDRDAPLDDAVRSEREYVRQRLREELKREPTEGELDEWLRQHTEGY
ncbi:MAG TPA: hypothetical protein VJT09_19840 [Pyrinomonadaceae bacterium]|nr:hypothetical protein [Pyrinomonadaceae bacterium]